MTADLSNVVTTTLLLQGAALDRDNPNIVTVFTNQQGKLTTANRFESYSSIDQVATDFGTSSEVFAHATTFFSTTPNAVDAGGIFVVGYWRGIDEDTLATPAILTGGQLNEDLVFQQIRSISDGSFDIDVDGVTQNVVGLDFRTSSNLQEAIDIISLNIIGATVSFENLSVVITSDTTGSTSMLTLPIDGGVGTFLGEILDISAGTGAMVVAGLDPVTLVAETRVEALQAVNALVNFRGFMFIDKPTNVEIREMADWAQANDVLAYDVFDQPSNLLIDVTNPVWDIVISGLTNYRCLYSAAGNRRLATSYMARTHTVNFGALNSAITMNLKQLSVPAEQYTQTQINAARDVGLDIYTTFKRVPNTLVSGANDFVDNRYNLIAFIDAVQTCTFNLLGGTATKIPQTRRGINQLVDSIERTIRGFVNAGVFAAGEWTSPDTFGDFETFNRNIREFGYYVLANDLAAQLQSERENRCSPPIQIAVKNAGAIHKVDLIINFNL